MRKKSRDLERFNMLFVDRELRMVELKQEIVVKNERIRDRNMTAIFARNPK